LLFREKQKGNTERHDLLEKKEEEEGAATEKLPTREHGGKYAPLQNRGRKQRARSVRGGYRIRKMGNKEAQQREKRKGFVSRRRDKTRPGKKGSQERKGLGHE